MHLHETYSKLYVELLIEFTQCIILLPQNTEVEFYPHNVHLNKLL